MTETTLAICAFLTLVNVGVAAFVVGIAATMIYSWFRKLQSTKDALPELLQNAINELATKVLQPYREVVDERGRARAKPNESAEHTVDLDEDYNEWMANS